MTAWPEKLPCFSSHAGGRPAQWVCRLRGGPHVWPLVDSCWLYIVVPISYGKSLDVWAPACSLPRVAFRTESAPAPPRRSRA